MINALSLFANVGIAESYFNECDINVVVANELLEDRAKFYSHLYPDTKMIVGDITNEEIFDEIISESKKAKVNMVIATPPCQGMSTAGKMEKEDERNYLITYAVEIVKKIKPDFVMFENVPQQLKTRIKLGNIEILIPDYIKRELSKDYNFNKEQLINASDYGVPQNRERAIFLLTKKKLKFTWDFPKKEEKITLKEALKDIPSLDPFVKDISYEEMIKLFPDYEKKKKNGLKKSKWHNPPAHIYRQVISMMHTPTGKTAFDNKDEYKPHKEDGSFVKGFRNTYKRQSWDRPGNTITMYNRTIGSQENVHPGHYIGKDANGDDLYSDARVFTVYELMRQMSLPDDWDIPSWASESFVRSVIGEGIPPLLVKKIMLELNNEK